MVRQFLASGTSVRLGIVALLAAVCLAGCGRKGPLELPPGAPQTQSPLAETRQENRVLPPVDDPGLIQPPTTPQPRVANAAKLRQEAAQPAPPINGPAHPPNRPFVLDPLL